MSTLIRATGSRWISILAILALAGTSTGADAAGRVFYEDWSSGDTSKWPQSGTYDRAKVVTQSVDGQSPPFGAKYMAQANWSGLPDAGNSVYESLTQPASAIPYNEELFIRMWVRGASDIDPVDGAKWFRMGEYSKGNSFYWAVQMNYGSGATLGRFFSIIETVGGAGPNYVNYSETMGIGNGKWHKIEIYFLERADATGIHRVWVDGVLNFERTGIVTKAANGAKWGEFTFVSNWSRNPGWEHDGSNHTNWGPIEVYSDTGTGATGNMFDATISAGDDAKVPSPPKDVSVE